MRLTKAIIKKAGGINKKAWALARKGSKKTKKVNSSKTIRTKTQRSNKVAKKRRSYKKKSTGFKMPSGLGSLIGPLAYGFVRERASDALANTELVQRLPQTDFTDEAVMLATNWGLRKVGLGKVPVVNNILRAQKQIELARVGQTFADMQQAKQSTITGTNKAVMSGMFIN